MLKKSVGGRVMVGVVDMDVVGSRGGSGGTVVSEADIWEILLRGEVFIVADRARRKAAGGVLGSARWLKRSMGSMGCWEVGIMVVADDVGN